MTLYCALRIQENIAAEVNAERIVIPLKTANGVVGMLPVFYNIEDCMKYAGDAEIMKVELYGEIEVVSKSTKH